MNQLGGWQRIGIAATALWFAFVFGKLAIDLSSGENVNSPFYTLTPYVPSRCSVKLPAIPNKSHYTVEELTCPKDSYILYTPEKVEFSFGRLLGILLGPPILLFAFIYGSCITLKWIVQGFRGGA